MEAPTFSVEVIILPVSDVERALRFYVDQVGFTLDVDYASNDSFRVVQLTPPGSSCSIQIGNGLTDAPAGSVRNIYLVVTDLGAAGAAFLNAASKSVRSGIRCRLEPGTEVSHPGSTPHAGTTPALLTSAIRMAIRGCYRSGVIARFESYAMWLKNRRYNRVDQAQ
jgi:catechol 2,3-dioxygenase-like lactoylglutathione lyase family enzyme